MRGKIPLQLAGTSRHDAPVVVGIDLGTTNSLVAVIQDGAPHVLAPSPEDRLLPSVVHYAEDGAVHVGREALEYLATDAERTVYSVKRLMGRGLADVQAQRAHLPFRISGDHSDVVRIEIDGKLYTAPEVSAQILRALKARAAAILDRDVRQAVITVPAYFNDSQRQATRDAGRLAGLDVLRIVNEPTAACLAYGLHERGEGTVAVYDLGGGTFDISILKLKDGIFEVLSTNGDTQLGGDDMDRALAAVIEEEIAAGFGAEVAARLRQRLRLAAERAKVALTAADTTRVSLELSGGALYTRDVTRDELEALIQPIVERTLGPCRQAVADAGLAMSDLDEVVLVGGSTRVPLVRARVAAVFGRAPHCELDPDEVVALGAAVQAGILAGQVLGILLLDVNPLSLGLETLGGAVEKIIPRNSTIPATARQLFTTAVDNQTRFDLHVVQGERELADDCRSLARFDIRVPPMPAGWPRLEVTFLIDENGILDVSAREQRSGADARIEVKPSYGLTDEEVEQMLIASFEHAEADIDRRKLIEGRVEAQQMITATEKQLPLADRFIARGEISTAEVAAIRTALAQLQAAVAGEDSGAIYDGIARLNEATQSLAREVWTDAIREAYAGKPVG